MCMCVCMCVPQLIEEAGRTEEENKPITDSWEELGLVSSSPKLLKKGIEGVVMKKIAAATKKGMLIKSHTHTHTHTRTRTHTHTHTHTHTQNTDTHTCP